MHARAHDRTRTHVQNVTCALSHESGDGQELVRFKEERRIHAMVMLAERQRSMREAEEKGKREEEEKRRATQDEMYRQIMQVPVDCALLCPRVERCR